LDNLPSVAILGYGHGEPLPARRHPSSSTKKIQSKAVMIPAMCGLAEPFMGSRVARSRFRR
jgi:hypothetical protein